MLKNKPIQNNKLTHYTRSAQKAYNNKLGGFTILEILVVLIIIGIIVSVGLNMYLGQQKASRDAERKSNIHMISSALQNYYSVKKQYPAVNTTCSASTNNFNFSCLISGKSTWINGLVEDGYIEGEIPNDPRFKNDPTRGSTAMTAMTSGGDEYVGASGWYYGYTSKAISDTSYDQRYYVIFGALEKTDDTERFGTYNTNLKIADRTFDAWDNNLFVVTSQ